MAQDLATDYDVVLKVQVVRIGGAGHSIHRDQYDQFMQALRAFWQAV